jgi:uncharacterized protein YdhG (YjbR/CyaY superfamily)
MTAAAFRRMALRLGGVVEGAHMGHPDFRVNGKVFASLRPDAPAASLKLTLHNQARFIAEAGDDLFAPATGAWGRQGWTVVRLDRLDEETLGEALTLAWQSVTNQARTRSGESKTTRGTGGSNLGKHATPPATTVDDYIARASATARPVLEKIRAIAADEVPDKREKLSYRMPAVFSRAGVVIYFAAFTNHIGLYPPVTGDAALAKALEPYRGEKGNLRFPFDRAMPYALIRRVIKARLREQTARRRAT